MKLCEYGPRSDKNLELSNKACNVNLAQVDMHWSFNKRTAPLIFSGET